MIQIAGRITLDLNAVGAVVIPQNRQRRAPFDWHFTIIVDGYPLRVDGFKTEADMIDNANQFLDAWKKWKYA